MISVTHSGSLNHTESFLRAMSHLNILAVLHRYGREGVAALSSATPVNTGRAASSWSYEVSSRGGLYEITWTNSDVENGFAVAVAIQYGHGTGTGGYISGQDYINPATRPIFDRIIDEVWEAVTSA